MRLALIGVPYSSSGIPGGEANAPSALRAAGLLGVLRAAHDTADYGDAPAFHPTPDRDGPSGIIDPATLIQMIAAVRGLVSQALAEKRLPVVIGGECPLLLGCLAATRDHYGRTGLLFVDGHEDAWPPHQSTTGEAADMELGLALGLTHAPDINELAQRLPLISPHDAVVLGPRDREELGADDVPSIAPYVTFMDDQSRLSTDPRQTIDAVTRRLHRDAGQWWFHVDLDVLSTEAMPAVRYQQPGGLTWQELGAISDAALRAPGLIGWDQPLYNPDLDSERHGADRIVAYLDTVMRNDA